MKTPLCVAPFKNIYVGNDNSNSSSLNPCCALKIKNNYTTLVDYMSSPELNSLKTHLLDREKLPNECIKCKKQEENNNFSYRNSFNDKLGQDNANDITQLELFVSNVCNLQCIMCHPNYSSSLAFERKKLGWVNSVELIDNTDLCIELIEKTPTLTNINFLGGEFFLIKDNLKLLDLCLEKQLNVSLVTNATKIMPAHIDKLKRFKQLEIIVSLDGVFESYEFMRYPASWKTFEHNLNQLIKNLPTAKFQTNFVVQPLNIQYMIPAMDYLNKRIVKSNFTKLVSPDWLDWKILTQNEAAVLCECLHQQLGVYKLTTDQKNTVNSYIGLLQTNNCCLLTRNTFIKKFSETINIRKHSDNTVNTHFGVLTELASEINNFNLIEVL